VVYFGGFLPNWNFPGVFSTYLSFYTAGRSSAAAMAGYIVFFGLAGPVGDYNGAHTAIIRGVFVYKSQWYSGRIYAPGSPR
jgi:hypothetical protein